MVYLPVCYSAILLSLSQKRIKPTGGFLSGAMFQGNMESADRKKKADRGALRGREGQAVGSFIGENALWCWQARKSTSFRKIFSAHFASRGGLYYSQEVDTYGNSQARKIKKGLPGASRSIVRLIRSFRWKN